MKDVASLGPISEGMPVLSLDGGALGTVRAVWGGFAGIESTSHMEALSGAGADVESDPEVTDLPEGVTPIGDATPGYMEVEPSGAGSASLYVPLSDIADVTSDGVLVAHSYEEATGGMYSQDPTAGG